MPGPIEPMIEPQKPDARAGANPQESIAQLIDQLRDDQLWLLRQLDAGRWPEWRLDLAALERELDQLLNQLSEGQA